MTKYVARFEGQIVGTRDTRSSGRSYSHAIVSYNVDHKPAVVAWCSRLDLAAKEQRKHQGGEADWVALIVPAEEAEVRSPAWKGMFCDECGKRAQGCREIGEAVFCPACYAAHQR